MRQAAVGLHCARGLDRISNLGVCVCTGEHRSRACGRPECVSDANAHVCMCVCATIARDIFQMYLISV